MEWDAVGAIAESLGAIGVIFSVLYLAYEVRLNTQTMRADAGPRAQMEWSRFNIMISEHPDRDTIVRIFDPNEMLSNFSEQERIVLTFIMRAFAQQVEAQYFQYQAKILEPEVWEAHLKAFAGLVSFPAAAEWWGGETTMPIYTKSFLDCVESVGKIELSALRLTSMDSIGTVLQQYPDRFRAGHIGNRDSDERRVMSHLTLGLTCVLQRNIHLERKCDQPDVFKEAGGTSPEFAHILCYGPVHEAILTSYAAGEIYPSDE